MAITTPNMALTAWNAASDTYDYKQLASNFIALDQHDHSSGNGVQINGATGIKDASIPKSKLSNFVYDDNTIPGSALQSGAVTPAKTALAPYATIISNQNIPLTNDGTNSTTTRQFLDSTAAKFTPSNNTTYPNMASGTGIITVPQSGIYSVSASFLVNLSANVKPGEDMSINGVIRATSAGGVSTSSDADNIAIGPAGFEYTADNYPVNVNGIRYLSSGQVLSFWYTCKLQAYAGASPYATNILFTAAYLGRYS
jgi:hypothetical protein